MGKWEVITDTRSTIHWGHIHLSLKKWVTVKD
jgi:hypothetical protein